MAHLQGQPESFHIVSKLQKSATTDDAAFLNKFPDARRYTSYPPPDRSPAGKTDLQLLNWYVKHILGTCPCKGHSLCLSCLLAHRPKHLAQLSS